ncbi:multicomponent Na+:H+ antiporter subunit E [Roseinatronobacter thiooxidans]|uniref:Multicomponent Na+:H+ antiporter subunit E n=1 Tax=Roseinatronobacter thiooxidans TaxID=121821 RepID=A0A2W7QJ36_9RHOB|nr:Na+/H+ antiporter subunit E [Roseinatronobacter thiooxidans]PZX45950.1 multicomponent Na+:H+ antiporter subunit E [Roseinatronobacter thiooxidans]
MTRVLLTALIHRALLLGGAWLALTSAALEALAPGAVAVAVAVWLSLRLLPPKHPFALWRLARHVPRFVAGSVVGGVDVARRAFSPDMRLNPGWLELPSDLPDGARVALGGELSLMPGTLSAGTEDGKLLVHLLDTDAGFDRAIPREAEEIAAIIGQARSARG